MVFSLSTFCFFLFYEYFIYGSCHSNQYKLELDIFLKMDNFEVKINPFAMYENEIQFSTKSYVDLYLHVEKIKLGGALKYTLPWKL